MAKDPKGPTSVRTLREELKRAELALTLAETTYATSLLTQLTQQESQLALRDADESQWIPLGGEGNDKDLSIGVRDPAKARRQAYWFWRTNPHARGIIRNFERFIIGRTFAIDFEDQQTGQWNEERTALVPTTEDGDPLIMRQLWDDFSEINSFANRMKETVRRTFRDGGAFIRKFERRGFVFLRFIEPVLVQGTGPGPVTENAGSGTVLEGDVEDAVLRTWPDLVGRKTRIRDGIEYLAEDPETVVAYHVGEKQTERIPAAEIIHTRPYADSNDLRGILILEVVMRHLATYAQWEEYRMVLNKVRTAVALVRKVEGTATQANAMIANRGAARLDPLGREPNTGSGRREAMPRAGTIITASPGVDWEFKRPNLDARDASEDGRRILLSISAGVGLPEMLVTGDWCHAEDTDVLTRRGWVPFPQLIHGDEVATVHPVTGRLEYQKPVQIHSFRYQGDMVASLGNKVRFMVTPAHEMWVATYETGRHSTRKPERRPFKFRKVRADALTSNFYALPPVPVADGVPDTAQYTLPDGRTMPMDAWLAFLGYFLSEGHVLKKAGRPAGVQLVQKESPIAQNIRRAIMGMGVRFSERQAGQTTKWDPWQVWRAFDCPLAQHLAETCGTTDGCLSNQKHLPEFVWSLSARQRLILLEALIDGDGSRYETYCYYATASKQLADDVQRLAFLNGQQATLSIAKQPSKQRAQTLYHVVMSAGHSRLLETARLQSVPYDGNAWCAAVPNGLLVTRWRGRVLVSGNSNANYSSSVESRTPAVREWEDWQEFFEPVIRRIVRWVVEAAKKDLGLPKEVTGNIAIHWPAIVTADADKQTNRFSVLHSHNVMSKKTWAAREDLNYDDEVQNFREEAELVDEGIFPDDVGAAAEPEAGGDPAPAPDDKEAKLDMPRSTRTPGAEARTALTQSFINLQTLLQESTMPEATRAALARYTQAAHTLLSAYPRGKRRS